MVTLLFYWMDLLFYILNFIQYEILIGFIINKTKALFSIFTILTI